MSPLRNNTSSGAVIKIRGVINRFGSQTVHDGIDLDVMPGEVMGVVGGSGSGKSVLLRTIIGLNRPASGSVEVFGRNVYALDEDDRIALERRWGVLFQDGALFSSLTVAENLQVPLRESLSMAPELMEGIVASKLGLVGLPPDAAMKYPAQPRSDGVPGDARPRNRVRHLRSRRGDCRQEIARRHTARDHARR